MTLYAEPAFFILLAVAVVPAIVLGALEKPIKRYGFCVSVVFLVLLFSRTPVELAAFVFFLVWASALAHWTQWLFSGKHSHAVGLYRLALALTIAPLVVYKIGAVFDQNLLGFIGISYITFKAVQVLIETRDGLIQNMSVFDYLYFLIFFAPFTSGPIMRSRPFVKQILTPLPRADYFQMLSLGAVRFLAGAVYKFVLAALCFWLMWFVPQLIGNADTALVVAGELAVAFFYGLYLFFDFAGYSLMAMGAGAALGIDVPRNFNLPFLSVDIKDFWNRWHITLSWWLRDYVFMRFSKAILKRKVFASRTTTACLGYVVNMTLMGFWHGLTPDYIAYGMYHGLLLALCELFQKKSKLYKRCKNKTWFKVVSWACTMVAVFFGFSLFSGQISGLIGV